MSKKTHDIKAKTGEYAGPNNEKKSRYQNVGALMQDDDGRRFIILQKWFNPAGIPSDRESIILSCFEPRDSQQQSQPQERQGGGGGGFDDDPDAIPF